ncbi:Protein ASPARTIC PROTEASE IN GUARD CELL 1 [Morella rubra]|uniref:Protein ASPARTIC PROTEASE IN GUARD CELL 1 n=1 Tax=Morella rubra TaxID=262757 RepID=A0A6A1WR04_9ROSI|nr:Protein ASPARTIC PROTEASE IN GUARD CELL 1 [Morella rubra]
MSEPHFLSQFDKASHLSQLGGDGPGCKIQVLAQAQGLQAGESLEEASKDGGEIVVVREELLEGGEVGKRRTPEQLFNLRLQRDALRVKALTSLAIVRNESRTGAGFSSSFVSGLAQGSGEYFTWIDVGTPLKYVYMVLDTGSYVVWIQFAPCRKCYKLDFPGCNQRQNCLYQVSYGDGSFTLGEFSIETLTFRRTRVDRVALGCGHDNEGLFVGAAGLLGLDRGRLSFPSQTGRRFNQKFSYCLVDRSASSRSSLVMFGDAVVSRTAQFTPLLVNPKLDTFYYVELVEVSVGGARVAGITALLFKLDPAGNDGVIIDSSTSTEVKVPTVVLHFRGAELSLPATNYLIPVDSDGSFCFAFAGPMSGLSIIGNIQQ